LSPTISLCVRITKLFPLCVFFNHTVNNLCFRPTFGRIFYVSVFRICLSSDRQLFKLIHATYCTWSRDSSVVIATRYGLESPGIESRWAEIFRTYPDRLRDPPSLLYNRYRVFPGSKGGRGVMLTTHPLLMPRLRKTSSTSTHPMGPPGPVTGFPLPFYILCMF
jgi:hypothetical protein